MLAQEKSSMRNDECIIYIVSRTGNILQSYHRMKDGWIQTSRNGTVRHCTVERLLSHILPPLARVNPAQVKVEKVWKYGFADKKKKEEDTQFQLHTDILEEYG